MSAPLTSTLVLGLAWFAAINAVASILAWSAATMVLRSGVGRPGGLLLAIRLFPAAVSSFFVVAVFAPAHWRLEPADSQEALGVILTGLTAIGAVLLSRSVFRVAAVARAGWRLRACSRLGSVGASVDAYEVPGLAGVSLAGVFRTRILIGTAVRRVLSAAELDVALAHERAHRRALDNLKRSVMFCAPDMFGDCAVSRDLEARWRASAEWLADARAVNGDGRRALQLASALVKVSRISADRAAFATSPAWSTLHDPPLLEMRVRRLVSGAAPTAEARAFRVPVFVIVAAAGLLCAAVAVSPAVHYLTEALVRVLP